MIEMTELAEYKGYRVEVDGAGRFHGYRYLDEERRGHEAVAEAESLKELKKALDKVSKASMTARNVFVHEGNRYIPGKMTSATQGRYDSALEYRVSFTSKRAFYSSYGNESGEYESWANKKAQYLIKDTPENRVLIEEYNSLEDQQETTQKRQIKISEQLVSYSDTELAGK